MKKKHFHSFNAFRFFSFFLVFIHHLPIDKDSFFYFFSKSGGIGVSFFFVLSGFLITYILLCQKELLGKVDLKVFFARRILKIWPLFYASILFAFLTPYILACLNLPSSNEGYKPNWLMSLLFLENYKMMLTDSFPNVSPLRVMWSLCVEEHFYIIWSVILYFIPVKKVPLLIVISILIANLTKLIYHHLNINTIDVFSNIDYFAYGAIPAYIYMRKQDLLEKVENISLQTKYTVVLIAVISIFTLPNLEYSLNFMLSPILLGLLFSVTILFTITKSNYTHIDDKYWISKLGIFTYGLYLYHTIMINLFSQILKNSNYKTLSISILSLLTTIIIGFLSYHLFERFFLELKKYFRINYK